MILKMFLTICFRFSCLTDRCPKIQRPGYKNIIILRNFVHGCKTFSMKIKKVIRLGSVKEYSAEGIICKNEVGENYIMNPFSMFTTHRVFLRALIESGCNGRDMWQINALVCAWKS